MTRFWNALLFTGGTPRGLALFRISFYLATLPYLFIQHRFGAWDFPESMHRPISAFALLPVPALTAGTAPWLYGSAALLALACAAGVGAIARLLFFAVIFYVFGNRYNFGVVINQVDSPLLLCAGLMIFARCDDALVPSWLRRGPSWPVFEGEYAWPVRFTRLFLALFFLEAGISKLRNAGFGWARGDALRTYLTISHPGGTTPSAQAILLAHPSLTLALSCGVLLFELSGAIALSPRFGRAYGITALVFLLSVRVVLGHSFLFSLAPLLVSCLYKFETA